LSAKKFKYEDQKAMEAMQNELNQESGEEDY
jgi:hypothetical protein